MHLCEKQSENVKNGRKLAEMPGTANHRNCDICWPKSHCSIESIGDLFDKSYQGLYQGIAEVSDSFTGDSSLVSSSESGADGPAQAMTAREKATFFHTKKVN